MKLKKTISMNLSIQDTITVILITKGISLNQQISKIYQKGIKKSKDFFLVKLSIYEKCFLLIVNKHYI